VIREKGFDYLFGVHSVMEKLKGASFEVVEVLIAKGRRQGPLRSIEEEAKRRGVSIFSLDGLELNRLVEGGETSGGSGKGVLIRLFRLRGPSWRPTPGGQVSLDSGLGRSN